MYTSLHNAVLAVFVIRLYYVLMNVSVCMRYVPLVNIMEGNIIHCCAYSSQAPEGWIKQNHPSNKPVCSYVLHTYVDDIDSICTCMSLGGLTDCKCLKTHQVKIPSLYVQSLYACIYRSEVDHSIRFK